ncbi:MAG: hypothetical protein JKY24_05790 [Pseudomonadales bacterium]|nr:hypothetical protein [Pseudomonadales bacterium]
MANTKYVFDMGDIGEDTITYQWHQFIDDEMVSSITDLMQHISKDTPIIGFSKDISKSAIFRYIDDLNEKLMANRNRLVTFNSERFGIIGLCTLVLNSNPNNRHIADLAKGMINPSHRGSGVLAGAFYEICIQCKKDNVDLVTLDVRANSAAQIIWQRFGFAIYGTLPDYARQNGQSFSGHFMHTPVSELKSTSIKHLKANECAIS